MKVCAAFHQGPSSAGDAPPLGAVLVPPEDRLDRPPQVVCGTLRAAGTSSISGPSTAHRASSSVAALIRPPLPLKRASNFGLGSGVKRDHCGGPARKARRGKNIGGDRAYAAFTAAQVSPQASDPLPPSSQNYSALYTPRRPRRGATSCGSTTAHRPITKGRWSPARACAGEIREGSAPRDEVVLCGPERELSL